MDQKVLSLDTLTERDFREQINEFGFVSIWSPRPVDFSGNYRKFASFLELRPDILEHFAETNLVMDSNNNPIPGSEVGYIAKSRRIQKDPKRLFHYHPSMWDTYDMDNVLGSKNPLGLSQKEHVVISEYFESQFDLWSATWDIHKGIISALESEFPALMKRFVNASSPLPHLYRRDLAYDDIEGGEISAKHHLDNGCWFTTALYETGPGLHMLDPKSGSIPKTDNLPSERFSDMVAVEEHPNQFLVFPGRDVHVLTRPGYVQPAWHGVLRSDKPAYISRGDDKVYGRGIGRGASVAFLNQHDFVQPKH